MSVRRFNYTGRQRIEHQRVSIELREPADGGPPTFAADLDLSAVNLPPDAPVIITAYRSRAAMRFPWGTAAALTPPADCRLSEVPTNPYFRVTALAPDGSGKVLALADCIHPTSVNRRQSLLWLDEADLEQEIWRLDFDEEFSANPTLMVNRNIPDIRNLVLRDPAFQAQLLPETLRTILTRALLIEEVDPADTDNQIPWGRWMGFINGFYTEDYPEPDVNGDRSWVEVGLWIDGAVAAFTQNRFPAKDNFVAARRD